MTKISETLESNRKTAFKISKNFLCGRRVYLLLLWGFARELVPVGKCGRAIVFGPTEKQRTS